MKSIFTVLILVVTIAFFIMPGKTFAVGSDTLEVYSSGASLDEIINSDTTAAGMQAHSVYKLVSFGQDI